MKRAAICSLFVFLVAASSIHAQSKLSVKWEELTAAEFRDAIQLSKGTCLLPFGILEKHGPHLPLGTDLSERAARFIAGGAAGVPPLFFRSTTSDKFLKPNTNREPSPTAWNSS